MSDARKADASMDVSKDASTDVSVDASMDTFVDASTDVSVDISLDASETLSRRSGRSGRSSLAGDLPGPCCASGSLERPAAAPPRPRAR